MQSPIKLAAVKALAAAAAAIVAVGSLAVAVASDDSDEDAALDVLRTAAEATEAVGSADVHVASEAHTSVRWDHDRVRAAIETLSDEFEWPGPPELPELPAFPQPPEPRCEDASSDLCTRLRARIEEVRRRTDRLGERRGQRQHFGPESFGEQVHDHQAAAGARLDEHLERVPGSFRCDYHFEGLGTMSIPGRMEISGDADVSCDPDFVDGDGHFSTALSLGGVFDEMTASTLPGFRYELTDGGSISELLRKAEDPDDEGSEKLDGVRVRHLSFSTGEGPTEVSVNVWIGVDDHVVRKLVTRSSGEVDGEGIDFDFESEYTVLVTNVETDR